MGQSSDATAELKELLERLREERITPDEVQRLEEIVLSDSAAMDIYVRYMSMVAGLRVRLGKLPMIPSAERPSIEKSTHPVSARVMRYIVGSSLAALAGLIFFLVLLNRTEPGVAATTVTLDHVSGNVVIVSPAGVSRAAKPEMPLPSGWTVRTKGSQSLARLVFADGTVILIASESVMTYTHRGFVHLMVEKGTLVVSAASRPRDKPLVLATPTALLKVLGTEFSLSATRKRTELEVTKGRVEFTRTRDGKSVVVAAGKRVVTDNAADLGVQDIKPATETWDEDFEDGGPSDWQAGSIAKEGLPVGSGGAIRAVRPPGGESFSITTPKAWMNGLFTVHPDSHLHMTFKMDRPNWINIFFITRTDDPKDPTTFLHKFDGFPFRPDRPGVWWTISIPINKFQRLTKQGYKNAPVQAGGLVFGISWTAPKPDRGLVIDRVWVTRGGPGEIVFREAASSVRNQP